MGNRLKWKMGHWEKSTYVSQGKRGYWSKYGSGVKWKEEDRVENWYCQSCNREQPAIVHPYKIPFNDSDSAKVCSFCKHVSLINKVLIYSELLIIIRPQGFTNAIANLLTLPLPY